MRRSKTIRLAWGRRLTRGRENARLARALAAGEEIRDTRVVAGALVWDRACRLTLIRAMHDTGARTVTVCVEPCGGDARDVRGVRAPGLARREHDTRADVEAYFTAENFRAMFGDSENDRDEGDEGDECGGWSFADCIEAMCEKLGLD